MHLRAVDVHIEVELITHTLDVFQAFLEIGAGATDPDLGLVLDEGGGIFSESTDDPFER